MNGVGSMPSGAILVKENYMPDSTLAATTVMYKVDGFDPGNTTGSGSSVAPTGRSRGKAGAPDVSPVTPLSAPTTSCSPARSANRLGSLSHQDSPAGRPAIQRAAHPAGTPAGCSANR